MAKVVNTKRVREFWLKVLAQRLAYKWNGKIKSDGSDLETATGIDCSGLTKYLHDNGTDNPRNAPHGSIAQREFCEEMGFERVDYQEAIESRDNSVFWCFWNNNRARDRHTLMLQNGHTLESFSGRGPASRPGTTKTLVHNVQACFKLS